jgi:regulator of sirC expression with transglutaminase-like and TPR domain
MMQFPTAVRDVLLDMAARDEFDLLDAMLWLSRVIEPDTDAEHCRDLIDSLAEAIREDVRRTKRDSVRIRRFVSAMRDLGFRGNVEHYYDPRNTAFSHVLERRTGIPISLAIAFIEIGRRVDVPFDGVGFPFHFLLRSADLPDVFVDPFFGTVRDADSCRALLDEVSGGTVDFRDQFLQPIDERSIFVRVLRNLKNIHKEAGQMDLAMAYCQLILAFDPEQPVEYRDRGTIALALGEWNLAVDDLSTYLAMIPDAADRSVVLGQIQYVLHQQNSIH